MTNTNMEIFKNEEFGSVRVVVIDNDPWFRGIRRKKSREPCRSFS